MSRKLTRWLPLEESHRKQIIGLAVFAQRVVEQTPDMEAFAKELIKKAVWRWTADAIHPETKKVVWDAIKYDIRYLPHTRRAAEVWNLNPTSKLQKFLRHEHSVPIKLITKEALSISPSRTDLLSELFHELCRGTVVTVEEDRLLNTQFRDSMPATWPAKVGLNSRYTSVGLEIVFPSNE